MWKDSSNKAAEMCFCVLCGLPGAGKTTLCKQLIENFVEFNFIHVCYDYLIPWIDFSSPDVLNTWKKYRNEVLDFVKFLVSVLLKRQVSCEYISTLQLLNTPHVEALYSIATKFAEQKSSNVVFLIDDNMPYHRMRYEYFQVARSNNLGYCTLMVDCTFAKCQERNKQRPIQEIINQKSLRRINAQMERPDTRTKNWEINFCVTELPENDFTSIDGKIRHVIQHALSNPIQSLPLVDQDAIEETRIINRKNLVHQADLCLRKVSSDFMKRQSYPQQLAEKVSLTKKLILNEIKSGQLDEEEFFDSSNCLKQDLLKSKIEALFKSYTEI